MSALTARKAAIEIGIMSCVPAMGQFYNGQIRKGLIFLAVDMTNLVLLSFLIYAGPALGIISDFCSRNHLSPNPALAYALSQLRFGSPFSLVVASFMLVFVALSMRDAYDNALDRRRHSLYPGHVLELIEATSSSYICRCTFLLFCLILAFFFLIPPPAPRQLTDIEFFQNQKPIKEKVESRRKAETNSKNSGKHKKKEENPEPSHENATAKRNNLAYRPMPRPQFNG